MKYIVAYNSSELKKEVLVTKKRNVGGKKSVVPPVLFLKGLDSLSTYLRTSS